MGVVTSIEGLVGMYTGFHPPVHTPTKIFCPLKSAAYIQRSLSVPLSPENRLPNVTK